MPDIKAVIFDVYETLAHNQPSLWLPTFGEICHDYGLPLKGQALWDLWKPLELGFRQERNQPDASGQLPAFKTYEAAWRDCFAQVFRQLGKGDAADAARRCVIALSQRELFPEAAEVVASLRRGDRVRLGVVSNADNDSLWPLLHRHGLEFQAVLTSQEAGAYKPHPKLFRLIGQALEVPAHSCLFVGDQQYDDVQGAHEAGMQTVWLNRNGTPPDPALVMPDYQVLSLAGVLDILEVPGIGRREVSSF